MFEFEVINQGQYSLECCDDRKEYRVFAKWDGCCDIFRYYNGYSCDSENVPEDEMDYIHVCNIRKFIEFLTDIADAAEQIKGFEGYGEVIPNE